MGWAIGDIRMQLYTTDPLRSPDGEGCAFDEQARARKRFAQKDETEPRTSIGRRCSGGEEGGVANKDEAVRHVGRKLGDSRLRGSNTRSDAVPDAEATIARPDHAHRPRCPD